MACECIDDLLDEFGAVCEAPGYNVFIVAGNEVATPKRAILEGITRATILELCEEMGIRCSQRAIAPYDFYAADEAFLTSTAAGLMPISCVDGRTIGSGSPGPLFRRLDTAYDQLLRSGKYGTRIPMGDVDVP